MVKIKYYVTEMVGSCVGLAVVAILYEGLKLLREQLQRKYSRPRESTAYKMGEDESVR